MLMQFQPCDILLTRSHSKLGAFIRFCTRKIKEAPSTSSHSGQFTTEGDELTAMIVEAQAQCNRHPMGEAYPVTCDTELCVFRPLNLTEAEKQLITDKASSYVGRDYGYFKLILHLLDWTLDGVYLFRRLGRMDRYPICSYVVASSFGAAGKNFGVAPCAASPDDIWDFCLSNPDKYAFIWQRGRMYQP